MLRPEQLVSRLTRRSGSPGHGLLTVAAPVWAGDVVGIGRRDYVCVVGEAPTWPQDGAARPVWVADATDPVPADAYLTALTAAINGDALAPVSAQRRAATDLLCCGRGVRGRLGLRALFTEAGNGWGSARLVGRRGQSTRPSLPWGLSRVVEDWEAAQGTAVVTLRRWPRGFVAQVRGAAGEAVAFDGRIEAQGRQVIFSAVGSVALTAGMVVTVIAY